MTYNYDSGIIAAVNSVPAAASSTPDFGDVIGALIILGVLIGVYFLPTWIAFVRYSPTTHKRGHRQRWSIFVINLFLGWSGLGWLGALIWSVSYIP